MVLSGAAAGQTTPAWPSWRGPLATGVSPTAKPPVEWSESKNVRWKVELPGRGSSTPVVWEDRVYVLTAAPVGVELAASHDSRGRGTQIVPHRMMVLALDRKTGKTVWERTAREVTPHEGYHQQFGTWASSSAVTDGEVLIASFESRGIYAYDMNGKPLWEVDLGDKQMRNQFGEGSTPALYKDRLVVVWDHQGESFIAALDKRTGKEIWRTKRDEVDSWGTPLVVENGGKPQVVTGAMNRIRSYDLATGELVWESAGLTANPIPSPVYGDGLVILMSGYRGNSIKAVKIAEARGDITATPAIAWTFDRDTPYVPSPLLYDNILYFMKGNTGVVSAFDAKSGKPHYALQRIDGVPNVFASPVGADGKVIVLGQDGAAAVLKHGPTYEVLATNKLEDKFDASPALVGGEIYLRGYRYLYCVAQQ
ncbi:MAG TPA: PQQ-binding-like beta-propeller repeat protein [Vicinamibacterales bacterium]|nr:PQQ-binding-like beta-propeller repeat protein [Vicinamibacterales bacterium]